MILNFVLSIASAVLLVLLFPRFNLVWLAPIALTPLLVAVTRELRWKWRFLMGYSAGVVYWFGLCNWIEWTLARHAGVSEPVAWTLFVLFCLAKALQLGVFAILAARIPPPIVAALWVVLEWTHPYTAFEWLNLGNAAADMSVLLRLAPFTGVWGISFAFALMSAAIAAAISRRGRLPSLWLLFLLVLFLLPSVPAPERGSATAVVVQPNMDDETLWNTDLIVRAEDRLRELSSSLTPPGTAALIVWPEMPAPFYDTDPTFLNLAGNIARNARANLLTGVVAHAPDRAPLNSALLLDSGGNDDGA